MIEVSSDIHINKLEYTSIFNDSFIPVNDTNMSNDIEIIDNNKDGIIPSSSNNIINDDHGTHHEVCAKDNIVDLELNYKSDSGNELKHIKKFNQKHMFSGDNMSFITVSIGVGYAILMKIELGEEHRTGVKEADTAGSSMDMDIPRRTLWDPGICERQQCTAASSFS